MRKSEKEALQAMLDDEQETIKALEKAYQRAIRRIDNHIRILESDEMTQSKIYQKRYQEAMKAQINAALDELHKKSNQTMGQSRILCKVQNVVQIEQNLCKTGAAQAAAALFIK